MDGVTEVIIGDGISSIPAYAFDMPEGAKITVPFSVKNIDDNAFFGKTSFSISSYEGTDAKTFAENKGISFVSLGIRYITGNVIAYYNNAVMANNRWTFDTSAKVLTITSNKSGYNESGAQDSKEGNWKSIITEIEEVVLVGNFGKITGKAFNGAVNLRKVTMPSVQQIDTGAFNGCKNLETVCINGRPCIEGVLDFSSIVGANAAGGSSFAKADVFNTSVKAEGIILSDKYSEDAPLNIGNLPDGISKIYGSTEYLESFCKKNNVEFVPFGRSSDNKFAWSIEDSTLTLAGEGILNDLGGDIAAYAKDVRTVVITKNVVEIADNALAELTKLTSAVFEGNAPKVSSGAKPFGEQADYFYISAADGAEGFDGDTWCGYAVLNGNYIAGDVNGDGEVTIKDVVLLAQYLAAWSVDINSDAADVNGDENVNIHDAVLLARLLAGWNVELEGPKVPDITDVPDEPIVPDDPEESEDNEITEEELWKN